MTCRGFLVRVALVLTALATLGITAAAAPAGAAYVHDWEGNFPVGGGKESFFLPLGLAVDNSGGPGEGDLYVGSVTLFEGGPKSKVGKFAPDGTPLLELEGADTPAGSFQFLGESGDSGLAADNSAGANAGDVYVADIGHKVIDRFDENGAYICQITGSATPSASECNGVAGSETPGGGFTPHGVAVDPADGSVYVTDTQAKTVLRFDSSGAYQGQISPPELTAPSSIAVDSTGAIYVANGGSLFNDQATNVVKLSPTGEFLFEIDTFKAIHVAVEISTDRLYVAEGLEHAHLAEYLPSGHKVSEFGFEQDLLAPALAVDSLSGRIYATDFTFEEPVPVQIYGRGAIVPDVVTGEASNPTETSILLHGSVDPAEGGDVVLCQFEVVAAADYDPTAVNPYGDGPPPVPCDQGPTISSPTEVSAEAAGLAPSSTYHFRLVAANSNGVRSRGEDVVFSTKGAPTIEAEGVTEIERYAATLTAEINPHGFDTEFRFEFVDDEHFQAEGFAGPATRSTLYSEIGDGLKPLAVNQAIAGLKVGTTYHFRAVTRNSRGTIFGPGGSFTTVPVATLESQWAYAHVSTATLEADINPLGLATGCRAEYVTDEEFQRSGYAAAVTAPCVAGLGAGSEAKTGRAELAGLSKATTYHFRFIAENDSGRLSGEDQTFTTFGIEHFTVEVVDAEGNPYTQAGGHPFASITHYDYNHTMVKSRNGTEGSINAFIKDVLTETPVGRIGSAVATPRCPGYLVEEEKCSGDSQVGTITVEYFDGGSRQTRTRGLYNVFTPEGTASRFSSIDPYVNTDAQIRTGDDYGMTIGTYQITEEARIVGATATIWGVPADPRHDVERRCPEIGIGCASEAQPLPILRNPTSCGGPLTSRAFVDTWQSPGDFDVATTEMPAMVACDQLRFDPDVAVEPTNRAADSPTGLRMNIHLPQDEDPEKTSTADLRNAVVELPEGLVLNPAVATGLRSCSPDQVELDGPEPARCPEAAKVGTALLTTPLLDHSLPGALYVATPHDNPFDSLFALYVAVHDPQTGVVLKLAGEVEADPATGRLTADFSDNPQLPFEDLDLRFFGGDRAMMRTPTRCGDYKAAATLTPWSAPASGPPAERDDTFTIDHAAGGGNCPDRRSGDPHQPSFQGGSGSPQAGVHTSFELRLNRDDGTQELSSLRLRLPPGLLARLADIPYCPGPAIAAAAGRDGTAEQASPSCPGASAVGGVEIGAGAGPSPFRAPGRVYLAGPYNGAPLSLVVVVPAVAGPYDLGTVVVRAALHFDPNTAEVTVDADPLPTILRGVPLDVRSIALQLDRPQFMVNPTSCDPMQLSGQITSLGGTPAALASPFQVRDCGQLGFKPHLRLRLLGPTRRGDHPRLRAVLRMPDGSANISRASVTLPPTQFLDNDHLIGICTREEFDSRSCGSDSVYGHATVWSPLLDAPLNGPVYLRSSRHRLPDLVADLDGQLRFTLHGRIDSARGGVRVNLEGIPDAPVSKFVITMLGGDRGLLLNSADVCRDRRRAHIEFEAQTGRIADTSPMLRSQCRKRSPTARAVRRASKRKSTRNPPSFGRKPTK